MMMFMVMYGLVFGVMYLGSHGEAGDARQKYD